METRARGVYVRGYYASLLKNKSLRISVQARRIGRRCQLKPSEFNQLKNKINLTGLKNLKKNNNQHYSRNDQFDENGKKKLNFKWLPDLSR
jgi:hypothetical protein